MVYQSTRGGEENVSPSLAIVQGLAKDGGLFVPKEMPKLEKSLEDYANLSYQDLAYEIMKLYLTDFTEEEKGRQLLSGALPRKNPGLQGYGTVHSSLPYEGKL